MDLLNPTRASVTDVAARWYARLHAPDCDGRDRAEFEDWLRANPEHRRAYADAEHTARQLDLLLEQDEDLRALAEVAAAEPVPARRHRWAAPAALAASLIAGLIAMWTFEHGESAAPPEVYATRTNELRNVVLTDKSSVHLDVDSEILVRMSHRTREITLTRGRALFEVAKDAQRPFVVTAGGTRTTALGTTFQIQRDAQRLVVVLTEGSVSVAPVEPESNIAGSPWLERLSPGEQLSLEGPRSPPVKSSIDTSMATSWSRGRLVFRGTPLAEAIEDVNRYSPRKLRLADASLAALPVGGTFIAGDSELILSAFTAALPLRSVDGSGGEILLFRRYESHPP
jgi:transmembrane sensor